VRNGAAVAAATLVALAGAGSATSGTATVPNHGDPVAAGEALVAAVQAAGAGDTIALSAGDYSLPSTLELTKDVTITGPATRPGARLDGGAIDSPGSFAGGRLDLIAIASGANVKLQDLAVIGTTSSGTAVDDFGTLALEDSLVGPNAGTGVAAEPGASVSVVDSTISDNGTGLFADGSAHVSLSSVTLAANQYIGIDDSGGGQIDVANTIVAGNGFKASWGKDCEQPIGADGAPGSIVNSIDGKGACAAPIHADPRVGPLADNGGPTYTRALLAGSPAIDAGGTGCPETDQRGAARVGGCDIGAFEYGSTAPQGQPSPGGPSSGGGSGSGGGGGGGGAGGTGGGTGGSGGGAGGGGGGPAPGKSGAAPSRAHLSGSGAIRIGGRAASFQFRVTARERTGLVVFSDPARGVRLRATQLSAALVDLRGQSATLRGSSVRPGGHLLGFTIRAFGGPHGHLQVKLSNGYAGSGDVIRGSLSITG
jgi:hypothetical protein